MEKSRSSYCSVALVLIAFFMITINCSDLHAAAKCFPGMAAPTDGSQIPVNAPAFISQSAFHEGAMDIGFDLQLFDDANQEITMTKQMSDIADRLFFPETDLEIGNEYRLIFSEPCATEFDNYEIGQVSTNHFIVGEAAPLPREIGGVTFKDLGVGEIQLNDGGCYVGRRGLAHHFKINLKRASDLIPFQSVTRFCLHLHYIEKDVTGKLCNNLDGSTYFGIEKGPTRTVSFDLYNFCPCEMQEDLCEGEHFKSQNYHDLDGDGKWKIEAYVTAHVAGIENPLVSETFEITMTNCGYSPSADGDMIDGDSKIESDMVDGDTNLDSDNNNSSASSCNSVTDISPAWLFLVLAVVLRRKHLRE